MKLSITLLFLFLLYQNLSLKAQNIGERKKSLENVVYKVSEDGDSLALDIFLPETTVYGQKTPVVMIIHGGAWAEGNKSLESIYYMRKLRERLNSNGFGVVSIDYTLVGKTVHFPTPIADCKDAVRWIRANASKYNFDADNIGLWGGSAGGHLALLVAYSSDGKWSDDKRLAPFSAKVNYVVDNFGPIDLNALLKTDVSKFTLFFAKIFMRKLMPIREKLIYALTGYSIDSEKPKVIETAELYSPITYIDSADVPTLIFHGTKDNVVPLKQSKKLHQLLSEKNVDNEFIMVKNGDHGFNNISQEQTDALIEKTVSYIKEQTAMGSRQ
ncbi:alpha/beta hydrolase [Olivibacter sp. SDN3]|uniref:alpha/beta hydrolase n=1 Tax=Olivibacter sp. SDN3 TaxID=2764720 RepID=UPI0016511B76|nr:alpha/beta hydrolase [Olivibacter sp. SDN3]QNL48056.1 alpha/beta hydrolase [Olivibacter sp. SDN3]